MVARGRLLRVLFVTGLSSRNGGGSWQSTFELAEALQRRGHLVAILAASRLPLGPPWFYRRSVNLATKLGRTKPASSAWWVARQPGRVARMIAEDGLSMFRSAVPENALPSVIMSFRPDVVVASSLHRPSWRRVHDVSNAAGLPAVLYLREAVAIGHLEGPGWLPDLILANADAHAEAAAQIGHRAVTIPSLVDIGLTATASSREKVLCINPEESRGVDLAFALAATCPELPFVFLEAAPLDRATWTALECQAAAVPNVELRRRQVDRRRIYADARVLLVPHRVANRPRVVLEAQANGIPVLGSRLGGIVEAIGPGGLTVPVDRSIGDWSDALTQLWDDPANRSFGEAALAHAARSDVLPEIIAQRVEEALLQTVT